MRAVDRHKSTGFRMGGTPFKLYLDLDSCDNTAKPQLFKGFLISESIFFEKNRKIGVSPAILRFVCQTLILYDAFPQTTLYGVGGFGGCSMCKAWSQAASLPVLTASEPNGFK